LSARRPFCYPRPGTKLEEEEAMARDRRNRWCARWRIALIAAFLPAAALAQGADELASMIRQSLDGIEYRIDLRPKQAAQDLQEQQRRLELLEQEAPNHPDLPALREKFQALQDGVAASLADAAGDVATGGGAAQIPTAPEGFTRGLEEVEVLQKQAESAFLIGNNAEAAEYLEQAESQMVALQKQYGDEIPKGHATLLVTQEKLAALKDQLAEAKGTD
jgi:septation ring formation regulator EzrA